MSSVNIELTKHEIHHLVWLIDYCEEKGIYYGRELEFWRRSKRMKKKLLLSMSWATVCPSCGKIHYIRNLNGFCSEACYNIW